MGNLLFIIIIIFAVRGCIPDYDQGYDDAWEERKNDLAYSVSEKYKSGYEDGSEDSWQHDQGCYDADSGKPRKSNNEMYLQGYKDCN